MMEVNDLDLKSFKRDQHFTHLDIRIWMLARGDYFENP